MLKGVKLFIYIYRINFMLLNLPDELLHKILKKLDSIYIYKCILTSINIYKQNYHHYLVPIYLKNHFSGKHSNISCFKQCIHEYKRAGCSMLDYINDILIYIKNMNYYEKKYCRFRKKYNKEKKTIAFKIYYHNINRNDMKKHLTKPINKKDFKEIYVNSTYKLPHYLPILLKIQKKRDILALIY